MGGGVRGYCVEYVGTANHCGGGRGRRGIDKFQWAGVRLVCVAQRHGFTRRAGPGTLCNHNTANDRLEACFQVRELARDVLLDLRHLWL